MHHVTFPPIFRGIICDGRYYYAGPPDVVCVALRAYLPSVVATKRRHYTVWNGMNAGPDCSGTG